jgi:hypothetical protein
MHVHDSVFGVSAERVEDAELARAAVCPGEAPEDWLPGGAVLWLTLGLAVAGLILARV